MSKDGNAGPSELDYLSALEELGEEIISDRREIVDLDRRRNYNREALRVLTRSNRPNKKTWIIIGSLLVKITEEKAQDTLKKDQVVLDCEINKLRSDLKLKVNRLRDMEHQPPVGGLLLNPLSRSEMNAMQQVMGFGTS